VPSDRFFDEGIGGSTSGRIRLRGDQLLTIVEEPNPDGVRIMADPSGGAQDALVTYCGGFYPLFRLSPGDEVIATCGSAILDVIIGPIEITFYTTSGDSATASLDSGHTVEFDPETFAFTTPETNPSPIIVVIGEDEVPVTPGQVVSIGSVAGRVTADCPALGTGLSGVEVDAYYNETGGLASNAVTDGDGNYVLENLIAGDYSITVVTPLGYSVVWEEEDVPTTVVGGTVTTVDFGLSCLEITPSQRGQGFWKHQVGVATGGKGNAQIDAATLCGYLDMIEEHFNSNAINQVLVYVPPPSPASCDDKLLVAKELLNLKGNVEMISRARQQLMALLLNVAGQKLSLTEQISEDDATVSQAITYCDFLLDDGYDWNDELAKDIANQINNAQMVAADVIPLTTDDIAYSPGFEEGSKATPFALSGIHPNPFNPQTTISYSIPEASFVSLTIYDVHGRLVRTLVNQESPAGEHRATWQARDNQGRNVASGIYFARLEAGGRVETKKVVLLK